MIEDVLSWERFEKNSDLALTVLPKKVELYNRLVAHTDNFFAISAIGNFSLGYLLIVTKKLIPSFSSIEENHFNEMNWFIKQISKAVEKTYDRKVVIFEHGMCACVGGLDRAHLHLMTVDKKANNEDFIFSINKVLEKRKVGIEYIEYEGVKLENIHDINEVLNSPEKHKYKIFGKQLTIDNIKNLDFNKWPSVAKNHSLKGGHYVYFFSGDQLSSFLTTNNFATQFGREVIFEVEIIKNKTFKDFKNKEIEKNSYANIWKWQEFPFNENVLKTMKDVRPALIEIEKSQSKESKKFNFKTFKNSIV